MSEHLYVALQLPSIATCYHSNMVRRFGSEWFFLSCLRNEYTYGSLLLCGGLRSLLWCLRSYCGLLSLWCLLLGARALRRLLKLFLLGSATSSWG